MSAPEESSTIQSIRTAHPHLRKVVHAQNRELSEAAARERQMREQIQHLPEPVVKAYVDVIRRRGDLSMSEALSLVSEVFAADE